jgi:hypothetical protein
MILPIRKFGVMYQGKPLKVLYIIEKSDGKLVYCAANEEDGVQVFVEVEKVEGVYFDDEPAPVRS